MAKLLPLFEGLLEDERPAQVEATIGLRPPLKWAGGKRWLAPYLLPLWEENRHRRLVEPLCGGLAVALSLMPDRAYLSDINPHAINFYRWLKRGLPITFPMVNDERVYYAYRSRFNQLIANGGVETAEAAQLFYYLNRTGYNGLCRFNRKGEFNVPFGRYATINYMADFRPYREAFAHWEFGVGDFERVTLNPDDFVYADPPYDVPFTQYSKEGFSWGDQVRLTRWLAHHPGPVVLSNQATPRIVTLYESLGFALRYYRAPRMISCDGDRAKALEVVATKGVRPVSPGNTGSGAVLEATVIPALLSAGYTVVRHADIGRRFTGRRHIVDVLATNPDGRDILISLKWQQVSGTVEQKVPFEAISLAEAVRTSEGRYDKAYMVLAGPGWTLKEFFVGGGLKEHLKYSELVSIVDLDTFIARVNRKNL